MMMETTFTGSRGMRHAINLPLLYTAFYWTIIVWETVTMFLCSWGGLRMLTVVGIALLLAAQP